MIVLSKKQQDAIKQVCQAASTKSHIQALENVHISASVDGIVKLKAGDSLIEVTRILVAESVESGFTTTVNAAKFMQAFNACNSDVTIIVTDGKMSIKSGRSRFNLPTTNPDSYPSYIESEEQDKIECIDFIEKVKRVAWASALDDVRFQLNGVFVGKHAVATNSHKLSMVDLGIDKDMIIPIESVRKFPSVTNYEVFASDNLLTIKNNEFEFKTKLIDARYPDYNRVIQKPNKQVVVNSIDFIEAVKSAALMADVKSKSIVFTFGKESKVESTTGNNRESSSIGFDCDAVEDIHFALNSSYLIELLNTVTSDQIVIGFTDQQMIISENDQTSLIMRVKV